MRGSVARMNSFKHKAFTHITVQKRCICVKQWCIVQNQACNMHRPYHRQAGTGTPSSWHKLHTTLHRQRYSPQCPQLGCSTYSRSPPGWEVVCTQCLNRGTPEHQSSCTCRTLIPNTVAFLICKRNVACAELAQLGPSRHCQHFTTIRNYLLHQPNSCT